MKGPYVVVNLYNESLLWYNGFPSFYVIKFKVVYDLNLSDRSKLYRSS